jgi:N-acetyl sugar amidotransferase
LKIDDQLIMANNYQQCVRCVMDTSDAEIIFDNNGICNHCTGYFEKTSKLVYQGESSDAKLKAIVDKIKVRGKGNAYDCLIGISGGVDSCYVAYVAKNLGLKALVVHMDNGWNSEISVKNIKNVVAKLGFDYISYVLDWEEFKDLQLSFLKASVPEAETPTDIAIPAALHKIAAQNNIHFIISGGNYATEGILPKSWHYDAKDLKYLKSIHRKFGRKRLKTFPTFGYKNETYYKFIKGIRTIYLLNYVPYSKKDAMKILEDELGWTYYGGKHYESKYTGFLHSYILPTKFNIDYRRATFSTQICAGEIDRETALDELKELPYDPEKIEGEKTYLCKKLGIKPEEFEEILKASPKSYKDYPNSKKMLEFIYDLYRKLKG